MKKKPITRKQLEAQLGRDVLRMIDKCIDQESCGELAIEIGINGEEPMIVGIHICLSAAMDELDEEMEPLSAAVH